MPTIGKCLVVKAIIVVNKDERSLIIYAYFYHYNTRNFHIAVKKSSNGYTSSKFSTIIDIIDNSFILGITIHNIFIHTVPVHHHTIFDENDDGRW